MYSPSGRQQLYKTELVKAFAVAGFNEFGSTSNASDFQKVEAIKQRVARETGLLEKRAPEYPGFAPGPFAGQLVW